MVNNNSRRTSSRVRFTAQELELLRTVLSELHITQAAIAAAGGVSRVTFSAYLSGGGTVYGIPVAVAEKMRAFLAEKGASEATLEFLLKGDEGKNSEPPAGLSLSGDRGTGSVDKKQHGIVLTHWQRAVLYGILKAYGIPQGELASEVGLSASTMYLNLRGIKRRNSFSYETAQRMREYLVSKGVPEEGLRFLLGQVTDEGHLEQVIERVPELAAAQHPKKIILDGKQSFLLSSLMGGLRIRQVDVAESIGVRQGSVSGYLRGKSMPYETAQRMCEYLVSKGVPEEGLRFLLGQVTDEGHLEQVIERVQKLAAALQPATINLGSEQGLFLYRLMESLAVRQVDVARAVHMHQSTIAKALNGGRVSYEILLRLYDYFVGHGVMGASLGFLLEQSSAHGYSGAQGEAPVGNPGAVHPDGKQLGNIRHVLTEHEIGYDALGRAAGVSGDDMAHYLQSSDSGSGIPADVWARVCDYLHEEGYVSRASLLAFMSMPQNLETVVSGSTARKPLPKEHRQGSARIFLTDGEVWLLRRMLKEHHVTQTQLSAGVEMGQTSIHNYLNPDGRRRNGIPVDVAEGLYTFLVARCGPEQEEKLRFMARYNPK